MNPFWTIKDLKKKLQNKEISAPEVVSYYQKRLEKHADKLGVTLEIFNPEVKKDQTGLLAGIPGLIKDNICQKGQITSAGSQILKNYRAPYDATATARIKAAGGISLGRSNMDEFAMGSSGEFSSYKLVRNPWNLEHSPGGSSAGSAAAVAAGLVPWALGTETGGSVRQPASFCNLVGLYPTYGLHSRYGVLAFASSTDQVGPLTRTVYDNALMTSILAGHDPKDSTSLPEPKYDFTKKLTGKLPEDITIGVLREGIESEGINPEVRKAFQNAVDELEKLGANIKYLTIPDLQYGIAVYFIISRAEAASNLARFDGSLYGNRVPDINDLQEMYLQTREKGFGAEVKRRILMGNFVLSAGHRDAFYDKAQHVRGMIRAGLEEAFKEVDLIISPTASTLPFKLGKESADPLAMYMSDYFTVPTCVVGMPGLSLPCGLSKNNLPIGFQFMGPRLSEELIYQVAYAFEQHTTYHKEVPTGYDD